MESLFCNCYLSVAAHKIVWADLSLSYMLLVRQATQKKQEEGLKTKLIDLLQFTTSRFLCTERSLLFWGLFIVCLFWECCLFVFLLSFFESRLCVALESKPNPSWRRQCTRQVPAVFWSSGCFSWNPLAFTPTKAAQPALSVCPSVCLSVCTSICMSVHVCVSFYLSVCLSVCLSLSLSLSLSPLPLLSLSLSLSLSLLPPPLSLFLSLSLSLFPLRKENNYSRVESVQLSHSAK